MQAVPFHLDGRGSGSDLSTTGATSFAPVGVAIDPAANKICWANKGLSKISAPNLDGTGAGSCADHDLDPEIATE